MADYTVNKLFNLLDERRHLPKYKLELRASPFFELFLPEVLTARYKNKGLKFTQKGIIPEFPLKKENNQSTNVDFFALSEDKKHAYLIELKTDMNSMNVKQDEYLCEAAGKQLQRLVQDIICISESTHSYKKYTHLLRRLECLCELDRIDFSKRNVAALGRMSRAVEDTIMLNIYPQIIYIKPQCSDEEIGAKRHISADEDCICFFQFADAIREDHGSIGKRFAKSLESWAAVKPGNVSA